MRSPQTKKAITTATSKSDRYPRIYAVVAKIPKGKVATYGEVALRAGLPRHARMVGYALHALRSGTALPWHRVINAQGRISLGSVPGEADLQRAMLEAEGVRFEETGQVDLARYGWGRRRRRAGERASGRAGEWGKPRAAGTRGPPIFDFGP